MSLACRIAERLVVLQERSQLFMSQVQTCLPKTWTLHSCHTTGLSAGINTSIVCCDHDVCHDMLNAVNNTHLDLQNRSEACIGPFTCMVFIVYDTETSMQELLMLTCFAG